MSQIIDFVIEITYKNNITAVEVDYPVDMKFESVLEEIYDHVGVKQNERSEMEVTIGKFIVSGENILDKNKMILSETAQKHQ